MIEKRERVRSFWDEIQKREVLAELSANKALIQQPLEPNENIDCPKILIQDISLKVQIDSGNQHLLSEQNFFWQQKIVRKTMQEEQSDSTQDIPGICDIYNDHHK